MKILLLIGALVLTATAWGQRTEPAMDRDHRAICYPCTFLREPVDPVATLNQRLAKRSAHLEFNSGDGYLRAVLNALDIPVESQILVFSKTSLQSFLIGPDNPRAIYFNDDVAVAYVRGSPTLEAAAVDPELRITFYTMNQERQNTPTLKRETVCLSCHDTPDTLGAPGLVVRSVFPGFTGQVVAGLGGSPSDHRTPFVDRWGGWYVSGKRGPVRHVGNAVIDGVATGDDGAQPKPIGDREPLPQKFVTPGYPSPFSDVVALSVFEHQMHMTNLITCIGWDARIAVSDKPDLSTQELQASLRAGAEGFVDYLLFIEESPFTAPIEGNSGFAERFASQGPFDGKGRSLRQLDLQRRLLRYPCSYMIYSAAFRSLPEAAKNAVYLRMWEVLSGKDRSGKYERLPPGDRKTLVEILRATLPDLPGYFVAP